MDANYVWNWKDILQTIFYAVQAAGIFVAIYTFYYQRKSTFQSELQANRSRLTEAYMNVHAYILRNQENIDAIEKLIRRGSGLVEFEREGEMTRAIELLYLKLNSYFLEWNYRKTYGLPMEEFVENFDNAMRGFATTTEHVFRPLVENFPAIFSDFPEEFMTIIVGRLSELRGQPIRPELNLQYIGGTDDAIERFVSHIERNMQGVESIKNTIFYRYHSAPGHRITEEGLVKYTESARHALRRGCIVTDLFVQSQEKAESDFYFSLVPTEKRNYYSFKIRVDYPLLQMLILRHRTPSLSFVLFGWGFPGGKHSNIYLSMGPETIDYFEDYFDVLQKHQNTEQGRHPPSVSSLPGSRPAKPRSADSI